MFKIFLTQGAKLLTPPSGNEGNHTNIAEAFAGGYANLFYAGLLLCISKSSLGPVSLNWITSLRRLLPWQRCIKRFLPCASLGNGMDMVGMRCEMAFLWQRGSGLMKSESKLENKQSKCERNKVKLLPIIISQSKQLWACAKR